jgi:hypothetical protein
MTPNAASVSGALMTGETPELPQTPSLLTLGCAG